MKKPHSKQKSLKEEKQILNALMIVDTNIAKIMHDDNNRVLNAWLLLRKKIVYGK